MDFLATVAAYPKPDDKIRSTTLNGEGGGNVGNALTCLARLGLNPRLISKEARNLYMRVRSAPRARRWTPSIGFSTTRSAPASLPQSSGSRCARCYPRRTTRSALASRFVSWHFSRTSPQRTPPAGPRSSGRRLRRHGLIAGVSGGGGTQAEYARALAYLIADPNVSMAVLGRPHAVLSLLRFIFSSQQWQVWLSFLKEMVGFWAPSSPAAP
ncbi:hypothetical protein JHK85_028346 [Glycine max]|nr:hypothetical protein JHK85_028346 [Glycine max]